MDSLESRLDVAAERMSQLADGQNCPQCHAERHRGGAQERGSETWGWKGRYSTYLAGIIEGTQEETGQRQNMKHNDG